MKVPPRYVPLSGAASLGLVLGFYVLPSHRLTVLLLAGIVAAVGVSLLGLPRDRRPLNVSALMGLATALVLGSGLGRGEGQASSPPAAPASLPPAAPAPHAALAKPTPPSSLQVEWLSGRLTADAVRSRSGATLYRVQVDRLRMRGSQSNGELRAARGSVLIPAPIALLVRGGALLDRGALIEVSARRGMGSAEQGRDREGGFWFGDARGFVVIDRGEPLEAARSSIRRALRHALERIADRGAGLLVALLLGERDGLDREDIDAFRGAGCSHILALSGQHLSILALLILFLFGTFLGPLRAALCSALFCSLFVWIAGPASSLLRALLMVWLSAVAGFLDRPQSWLSYTGLSFLILLPMDPQGARSLSFILSYLAVSGMAVLAPRVSFILRRWLPRPLATAAAASCAAQAATAPVVILSFGSLPLIGLVASIAAAPLVALFMWWGMGAALVCAALPFLARFIAPVTDLIYEVLSRIMGLAATAPALNFASPRAQFLGIAGVVALAAFVYALPDVGYHFWKRSRSPRLRQPRIAAQSPGERGLGHVQAFRPELPDQLECTTAHSR